MSKETKMLTGTTFKNIEKAIKKLDKTKQDVANSLLKEAKLRERILILQSYRKNGIRTLEEAERYEKEKKGKENELE